MVELLEVLWFFASGILVVVATFFLAAVLTEEWLAHPWRMVLGTLAFTTLAVVAEPIAPWWVWGAVAVALYFSLLASMVARLRRGISDQRRAYKARDTHHHDGVWHDHTHDGRHRHPYGDDRFVYTLKGGR